MAINIEIFVREVYRNAREKSTGFCARYIRLALEKAGGVVSPRPKSAKDYGRVLIENNFHPLSNTTIEDYRARHADIIVWNENVSTKHGHIQVFIEGAGWVSDFKQKTIYPNSIRPQLWLSGGYKIYRYKNL